MAIRWATTLSDGYTGVDIKSTKLDTCYKMGLHQNHHRSAQRCRQDFPTRCYEATPKTNKNINKVLTGLQVNKLSHSDNKMHCYEHGITNTHY